MTDIQKKAYKDFKKGMKAADISKKYDVPAATVRTWINRKWKEKSVSSSTEKIETKNNKNLKQKGAPLKNKNAIGNSGGAPKRNQNNLKHGAYCKVFMDALFEDEIELLDDITTDSKTVLEQTILTLTIRERRLLKQIVKVKKESEANKNLTLGSVTKIHTSNTDGAEDKTITVAEATFNVLKIYEAELTKIETQKTRIAVELEKLCQNRQSTETLTAEDLTPLAEMIKNESD